MQPSGFKDWVIIGIICFVGYGVMTGMSDDKNAPVIHKAPASNSDVTVHNGNIFDYLQPCGNDRHNAGLC